MSRIQKTTMEQDREARFPFLSSTDLQTPFWFILLHARSVTHLGVMLCEWLPPHWRLSNEERVEMQKYWKQWYKPHRMSGGTSDHLVRDVISRVCINYDVSNHHEGLRGHYIHRLLSANQIPNEKAPSWVQYKLFDTTSGFYKEIPCSFQGISSHAKLAVNVYPQGEQLWWISIGLSSKLLTEELTNALLRLPGVIGVWLLGFQVIFYFGLDGPRVASCTSLAEAEYRAYDELVNVVIAGKGLVSEIRRQFEQANIPVIFDNDDVDESDSQE